MTVLAERYVTRRRFISESRKIEMQTLKERIERGEYAVDAEKVADAIVRHLQCSKPPH